MDDDTNRAQEKLGEAEKERNNAQRKVDDKKVDKKEIEAEKAKKRSRGSEKRS